MVVGRLKHARYDASLLGHSHALVGANGFKRVLRISQSALLRRRIEGPSLQLGPPGATIIRAYIQFEAEATQSEVTNLVLRGQAADNPPTFTTASNNISSRATTAAAVAWSPAAWTAGDLTAAQRTPSLTNIVQELVNRSGWASGNAMAFIVTGTGTREAVAYDGDPSGAAILHIEIEEDDTPPANQAPVANAGPDQEVTLPSGVTLNGSATDDGLPGPLSYA